MPILINHRIRNASQTFRTAAPRADVLLEYKQRYALHILHHNRRPSSKTRRWFPVTRVRGVPENKTALITDLRTARSNIFRLFLQYLKANLSMIIGVTPWSTFVLVLIVTIHYREPAGWSSFHWQGIFLWKFWTCCMHREDVIVLKCGALLHIVSIHWFLLQVRIIADAYAVLASPK